MPKRNVSAVELSWIVLEALEARIGFRQRLPLAVVPDGSKSWRIVCKPDRRHRGVAEIRKVIPALEKKLREKFTLKID